MTITVESLESQEDLQRAVRILKEAGCSRVFLFGSVASGKTHERSDLDLAVQGCPQGQFFRLLGQLFMELDTAVDLIDLDNDQDPFVRHLSDSEELIPLA